MMEEQYLELADRYVMTDFLIKVLERDKKRFASFKLAHEYSQLLDSTILRIRKDMYDIKKKMYRNKVQVVEIEGESEEFVYYTVFHGQTNTKMTFLRAHLRNRVGQLFNYYMIGDETFFSSDYYAPK